MATRQWVKVFLAPIKSLVEGINLLKVGSKEYQFQIQSGDEFEDIAKALNNSIDKINDYDSILQKKLLTAKEQKDKIFDVYRDVIFSVTQGKFNLLPLSEMDLLVASGDLYCEMPLQKPEGVNEARLSFGKFIEHYYPSQIKIMRYLLCVSEAATNDIKHAQIGVMQIRQIDDTVRVFFKDCGPGMDFNKLPNMIFLKGFSTKISLGCGFSLMYKYSDKIYLSTSENGTILGLEFIFDA